MHDHKHSSLAVYKKETKEEYSCDVIIIKRTDKNFDYDFSKDKYEWLDVRPRKESCYADLVDNRDNTFMQSDLQLKRPMPVICLDDDEIDEFI